MCGHSGYVQGRKETSSETESCQNLDLGLSSLHNCEKIISWCLSHPVYGFFFFFFTFHKHFINQLAHPREIIAAQSFLEARGLLPGSPSGIWVCRASVEALLLEVRVTGRRDGSHKHYELVKVLRGVSTGVQVLEQFVHGFRVPSALQEAWERLFQGHLNLPLTQAPHVAVCACVLGEDLDDQGHGRLHSRCGAGCGSTCVGAAAVAEETAQSMVF